MKICSECGCGYDGDVCQECGLVYEDEKEFKDETFYPYDEDDSKSLHYGDPVKHSVSNIAVMTKVRKSECLNPDLRRALQWDENYEWEIVKPEIVKANISQICSDLGIKDYVERCILEFKKLKNKDIIFTGKRLEYVAFAWVYTMIRIDGLPYTLFDLKQLGYNSKKIDKYYRNFFVKKLGLYKKIKAPNIKDFINKFINSLIEDDPKTYSIKYEIANQIINDFLGYYAFLGRPDWVDPCYFDAGVGLAAAGACLYDALKKNDKIKIPELNQECIAKACECTEVTLREHINRIREIDKQRG